MKLSFGSYIKKLRQDHRLTLRQVSATVDIDQSTLAKIEKNKVIAPQYIIKPLAALFSTDFETLQVHYLSEKLQKIYHKVPYALDSLEQTLRLLKKQRSQESERSIIEGVVQHYFVDKPVEKVWLFGSTVSDALDADSDVDLLVRFSADHKMDLFDYMSMTDELENMIKRPIDLVAEGNLDKHIVSQVNRQKELIYEKG